MSFPSLLYPPTPISTEQDPIPQNFSPSTPYIPKRPLLMAFSRLEHCCIFKTRSCTLFSVGLNIGACYVLGIGDQEGSVGLTMWFFQNFPLILFYFNFFFQIFLIFFLILN